MTTPAAGQAPSPGARADVSGMLGWQIANVGKPDPTVPDRATRDRWHNDLFAGAAAGWYWTEHLKTEVDAGASTEGHAYLVYRHVVNGQQLFENSHLTFSRRTLAITQQYQFFENAWFHPHVGAGVSVRWEHRFEEFQPLFLVNPVPGGPRTTPPRPPEGPSLDHSVRPFLASGFKAYITHRAFFRGDIRAAFGGRVDEVLVRGGFGIDF